MVIAWRIAVADIGQVTFAELHDAMPIMWIIDLAPTALGIIGSAIGVLHLRIHGAYETARNLAEEIASAWTADLRRANVEIASALDERDRFYAALSEGLRTPVSSILEYSELTSGLTIEPDEVGDYISDIYGSAALLLEMVNDLLDVGNTSQHGLSLRLENIDGNSVAEEVAQLLQPLAASKGLRLNVVSEADVGMRADPVRLRQLLTNLVANAIRWSDRGTITLHTRTKGHRYEICVWDETSDILPNELEAMFRSLEDIDEGADAEIVGLGLAVSRAVAEAMEGSLNAESRGNGSGTEFKVELPVASWKRPDDRTARLVGSRSE